MSEYTKGPWTAVIDECAKVRDSDNALVATFHHINARGCRRDAGDVAKAARLTAAAPEMYEALKAYESLDAQRMKCKQCEDCLEYAPEACGECFPFADDARLKMRAAIAKAIGSATHTAIGNYEKVVKVGQ